VKRLLIIVLMLALGTWLVAACDSSSESPGSSEVTEGEGVTESVPESTPATTPAADMTPVSGTQASFGQALDFGGLVVRVDTPIEDSGATPREGNRAWAGLVTFQNNRTTEVIYSQLDFHFVDGQGTLYEALGASDLPMLGQGILAPGAQAQAYILMDLPAAVSVAQIKFEPYIPSPQGYVGTWQ
jgi:hypothetical protein